MNHPTAHELLDHFNEIERERQMGKSVAEKIVGEKDDNNTLTIAYMMGAESANDTIRALKRRIEELEKDSERIDWLQNEVHYQAGSDDNITIWFWNEFYGIHDSEKTIAAGETLRDVIDTAKGKTS